MAAPNQSTSGSPSLHGCLPLFTQSVLLFFFLFSSLSKDPCHIQKKMPRVFVIDGKMEKQVKRSKEISFAWIRRYNWLGECLSETPVWPWRRTRRRVLLLHGAKDGRLNGAVMATHLHTHTHWPYMHKRTQKHKETLVRVSYCAPLWQYYVWARRTLICLLWREVHFSAIFSPLELEWEWTPAPPPLLLSSSPSILPATTHPLIVSAASANEGPQGPVHSHQGGAPMLHASFKVGSWVLECFNDHLYHQRER